MLGYSHVLHTLAKGWFGVVSKRKGESQFILGHYWFFGKHVLALKMWHLFFESRDEVMSRTPIWVKFPRLVLEFYMKAGLRAIGDTLGKFVAIDECCQDSSSMLVVRILV